MAEEVVSEYTADRGLSIFTIITNLGFDEGQNHPQEVTVCHAVQTSYFHFAAICEVQVFQAISYHGTHHVLANQMFAHSVSMAISCFDVSSFMTLLKGVGELFITCQFGRVIESTIYGCIQTHQFAITE